METEGMKRRTKAFALNSLKAVRVMPRSVEAGVITRQLVRCSTSVGANYRAACLARSKADKLGIVAEEVDEASYWMELLVESGICSQDKLSGIMREARELTSIILASIKTARMGR